MKKAALLVACVLGALATLSPDRLAAEPVVNTFKVSVKAPGLTVGARYLFTFRLFATAADGVPLFEESRAYRVPADRTIAHQLGSVNVAQPLRAEDFLQQLWVEASVPNRAPFARVRLAPAPLAIGSQNADLLDGLDSAAFAPVDHTHASVPSSGDADTLDGQHGAYYRDAANLTGTVPDGRLGANVARLAATQTVTGATTFNPPGGAPPFAVNAANGAVVANLNADLLDGLHGSSYLNAGNLASGTLATDRYSAYADLGAEGYLANAAGDLALNNGSLQATLYAERAQRADSLDAAALTALDLRYGAAPLVPSLGGYAVSIVESSPAGAADSSIGVTIGSDGLPVVVYVDPWLHRVNLLHCDDDACTFGTVTVVGTAGAAGAIGIDAAVTIGSDGYPVIAFFEDQGADLKIVHCNDVVCSSASTVTPDSAGAVGMDPSITTGTDGYPVVSYYDVGNGNLKVFHCSAVDCSSGSATAPDTAGSVGSATSIAIGAGGFPVVSYWDSAGRLKLLLCGNAACTAGNSVITGDDSGSVGGFTSVTIGADGFPVAAYYDQVADNLMVFHCGNAACSSGNTATTVDSDANDVGMFPSITVGAGGLPVVSYFDNTNANLKALHCGNAACTAGNSIRTVDSAGNVGWNTSATSGPEGLPVIAFWDFANGDVKLARHFIRPLGRR